MSEDKVDLVQVFSPTDLFRCSRGFSKSSIAKFEEELGGTYVGVVHIDEYDLLNKAVMNVGLDVMLNEIDQYVVVMSNGPIQKELLWREFFKIKDQL
jgi:hypothetical protein